MISEKEPFDVEEFLAQPLMARVATTGPTVRPVWFLWEDGCFWWLTGSYARLEELLKGDPRVSLVVDTCDLATGQVRQITARGVAEVVPLDVGRAVRKLSRYLGPDQRTWDPRFLTALYEDSSTRMVRLAPDSMNARDLSFETASQYLDTEGSTAE